MLKARVTLHLLNPGGNGRTSPCIRSYTRETGPFTPGRETMELVLLQYTHVFHDDTILRVQAIVHQIIVDNALPIRRPPYQTSYALRGNEVPN